MKATPLLAVAALARALVIPDPVADQELSHYLLDSAEELNLELSGWEYAVAALETLDAKALRELHPGTRQSLESDLGNDGHHGYRPPRKHWPWPSHHPPTNKTILGFLQDCNATKIFSHLVTTYSPSLTSLLNSTDSNAKNYTVLAPLDKGFKRLSDHFKRHNPDLGNKPKKPSNETIEKFLMYHVVQDEKPLHALLFTSTLPTLLDGGETLGGMQRIRLAPKHGFFGGLKVNFMSEIVAPNHFAKNGLVHFLKFPLLPPPTQLREISLMPSHFSTLSLALIKTGLGEKLAEMTKSGGTLFAPSNQAFAKLGPEVNAFLFNTEKGLKILEALLKYHVVVDKTLYSDAFYNHKHDEEGDSYFLPELEAFSNPLDPDYSLWVNERADQQQEKAGKVLSQEATERSGQIIHADLPTLLSDKSLAVDTRRAGPPFAPKMWVNRVPVLVVNGIASDGVVHVPTHVLIPHCDKDSEEDPVQDEDMEWTVEELVQRVVPLLEISDAGIMDEL